MKRSVPVLYYHRVNDVDKRMSVPPALFSSQISHLSKSGWHSLGMEDLLNFIDTGKLAHPRSFVITFDDGYFDNWHFAFPVLEHFSTKAIIFLITDFVNEKGPPRAQADIHGQCDTPVSPMRTLNKAIGAAFSGDTSDFLFSSEVISMYQSGLIEFGSHSSKHQPSFASSKLENFILTSSPHWSKSALVKGDIRPGVPLYEWASSITVPVYRPSAEIRERFVAAIERQGGWESAKNKDKEYWRKLLMHWGTKILENDEDRDIESLEDAKIRIISDLSASRKKIENMTGGACMALCWPWGHHSKLGIEAAKEAGLKLGFTTENGAICTGDSPFLLPRLRVSGRISPAALETAMRALTYSTTSKIAKRFSKPGSKDKFLRQANS